MQAETSTFQDNVHIDQNEENAQCPSKSTRKSQKPNWVHTDDCQPIDCTYIMWLTSDSKSMFRILSASSITLKEKEEQIFIEHIQSTHKYNCYFQKEDSVTMSPM